MNYRRQIASDYIAAGVSVIPIRVDGSKAPAIASWKQYQRTIATDADCRNWFSDPSARGIAIVCGVVSAGVEVLDFDEQPDEIFAAWKELLSPSVRRRLCVVETGGLGYHVLYL